MGGMEITGEMVGAARQAFNRRFEEALFTSDPRGLTGVDLQSAIVREMLEAAVRVIDVTPEMIEAVGEAMYRENWVNIRAFSWLVGDITAGIEAALRLKG